MSVHLDARSWLRDFSLRRSSSLFVRIGACNCTATSDNHPKVQLSIFEGPPLPCQGPESHAAAAPLTFSRIASSCERGRTVTSSAARAGIFRYDARNDHALYLRSFCRSGALLKVVAGQRLRWNACWLQNLCFFSHAHKYQEASSCSLQPNVQAQDKLQLLLLAYTCCGRTDVVRRQLPCPAQA